MEVVLMKVLGVASRRGTLIHFHRKLTQSQFGGTFFLFFFKQRGQIVTSEREIKEKSTRHGK